MPKHRHKANMKRYLQSRPFKIGFLFALVVAGATVATLFGTGVFSLSVVNVNLNPADFYPTYTSSRLFDVSSAPGGEGPLATGITYSYSDPDHKYPGVSIFQSEPYMSDRDGNPVVMNESDILRTSDKFAIGDKVFYVHQYYQTIQIGARTRWNMPTLGDTTSYVSPFSGDHWDGRAYSYYYRGTARNPGSPCVRGDLVMYDSHNDWNEWFNSQQPRLLSASKGTVSSSIVKMWFNNVQAEAPYENQGGFSFGGFPPTFSYTEPGPETVPFFTYAGAADHIAQNFGNSKIYVYPTINVRGLSNYISYKGFSYEVTLPDGTKTTCTINTQSANVGFLNARKTGGETRDLVPVDNPAGVNARTYMESGDVTKRNGKDPYDDEKESDLNAADGFLLTGYIHPRPWEGWVETGYGYTADTTSYWTSLDDEPIQIKLDEPENNNGMAQDLVIKPEIVLQPLSQVYWTEADVKWDSLLRTEWKVGVGVRSNDRTHSGTARIKWPYAIDVTNVFAMSQYTFRVGIVTENQLQMVKSDGSPIDAAKAITDFGSAAIVRNPNADAMDVSLYIPPEPSFWDWLTNLFGKNLLDKIMSVLVWIGIFAGIGIVLYLVVTKVRFGGLSALGRKREGRIIRAKGDVTITDGGPSPT